MNQSKEKIIELSLKKFQEEKRELLFWRRGVAETFFCPVRVSSVLASKREFTIDLLDRVDQFQSLLFALPEIPLFSQEDQMNFFAPVIRKESETRYRLQFPADLERREKRKKPRIIVEDGLRIFFSTRLRNSYPCYDLSQGGISALISKTEVKDFGWKIGDQVKAELVWKKNKLPFTLELKQKKELDPKKNTEILYRCFIFGFEFESLSKDQSHFLEQILEMIKGKKNKK